MYDLGQEKGENLNIVNKIHLTKFVYCSIVTISLLNNTHRKLLLEKFSIFYCIICITTGVFYYIHLQLYVRTLS